MKRLLQIRYTDNAVTVSMLLLRVGLGLMMIPHGYQKLINFADRASKFADPFHIGSSTSMALTIFAEFFCSVFIILGLFTRLAAIPPIIAMSVALFYSNRGDIFGTGEKAGLFLIGFLVILLLGPGKISADKLITGK
ncbi:MAG: DoxX family protein [Chitinophagaceae bacterium]